MNKFQSSLVKIFRVILILIVLMILIPVAYICNKSSSKRVQNENRNIHTIYKEGQDTYFFSICRSVSVLLSWWLDKSLIFMSKCHRNTLSRHTLFKMTYELILHTFDWILIFKHVRHGLAICIHLSYRVWP